MEFPALVYRSATVYLQVQDEAGHAAALADGWFASVPEAMAPKLVVEPTAETITEVKPVRVKAEPPPEPVIDRSTEPVTRLELEKQAHKLGIVVDRRWGDATLAKKIAEAG